MKNRYEQFEYKLTQEERADMRARLRFFMAEHPVEPSAFERFARNFTYGKARRSYLRPALAGMLIVFLVGGGTSYAAADAPPGAILYAIKTRENEPITSALALSPEAKASVSATLALKRIEEAEVLASEGRLSFETRVELESKFEEYVIEFEEKTALAEREDAMEEVADVQSDFEASLKVHAAVLTELSSVIPEAEKELASIQRTVAARVATVESARTTVENAISARADKKTKDAAEGKKRIVEREASGRSISSSARSAKASVPEIASMTMMMAVDPAADMGIPATTTRDPVIEGLETGSAAFEVGQYGEAFTKFQSALRALKQEKDDQDVRKRLNFNVGQGDGDDEKNEWNSGANEKKGNDENEKKDTIDEDARDEDGDEKKSSDDGDTWRAASSTGSTLPINPLLNEVPVRVGL